MCEKENLKIIPIVKTDVNSKIASRLYVICKTTYVLTYTYLSRHVVKRKMTPVWLYGIPSFTEGTYVRRIYLLTRVYPSFFDQVGHQTTNASIGNKYFFTK